MYEVFLLHVNRTVLFVIYLRLSVCILCVFVSYCIVVVLLWAWWGGPDGIEV